MADDGLKSECRSDAIPANVLSGSQLFWQKSMQQNVPQQGGYGGHRPFDFHQSPCDVRLRAKERNIEQGEATYRHFRIFAEVHFVKRRKIRFFAFHPDCQTDGLRMSAKRTHLKGPSARRATWPRGWARSRARRREERGLLAPSHNFFAESESAAILCRAKNEVAMWGCGSGRT